MPYPKILFIRHGETEWNAEGRTQGILNSPLTQKGRAQAEQLGKILVQHDVDPSDYFQVTSPLGRTLETVAGIQKHVSFDPIYESLLQEINLGNIGGMTRYEIEMEYPEHLQGKKRLDWYFGAPEGETFEQIKQRAKTWLDSLTGPTIAVSHGQLGKLIRGLYCGLTDEELLSSGEPQGVVIVLEDGKETFWELETA